MHEHVAMPARSRLNLVRNQAHTVAFQFAHYCFKIGDAQANMMQSLASLCDVLRDR
jgi:hypothetical protein